MTLQAITDAIYRTAKLGEVLIVTFGSKGTQRAQVVGRTRNHVLKVIKYRAKSDRWTKPVALYAGELIGRAN